MTSALAVPSSCLTQVQAGEGNSGTAASCHCPTQRQGIPIPGSPDCIPADQSLQVDFAWPHFLDSSHSFDLFHPGMWSLQPHILSEHEEVILSKNVLKGKGHLATEPCSTASPQADLPDGCSQLGAGLFFQDKCQDQRKRPQVAPGEV